MEKETKLCPYCGEEILATAKKCKHCGEWIEKDSQPLVASNDTPVILDNGYVESYFDKTIIQFILALGVFGLLVPGDDSIIRMVDPEWHGGLWARIASAIPYALSYIPSWVGTLLDALSTAFLFTILGLGVKNRSTSEDLTVKLFDGLAIASIVTGAMTLFDSSSDAVSVVICIAIFSLMIYAGLKLRKNYEGPLRSLGTALLINSIGGIIAIVIYIFLALDEESAGIALFIKEIIDVSFGSYLYYKIYTSFYEDDLVKINEKPEPIVRFVVMMAAMLDILGIFVICLHNNIL